MQLSGFKNCSYVMLVTLQQHWDAHTTGVTHLGPEDQGTAWMQSMHRVGSWDAWYEELWQS